MNEIKNTLFLYCDDCLSFIINGNKDRNLYYLLNNQVNVLNYEKYGMTSEEYYYYKDYPTKCSFCDDNSLSFKTLIK